MITAISTPQNIKKIARQNHKTTALAFNTTVQGVLDNHATIKKKSVTVNDGPFMAKTLRTAIMNRTRFRNIYCKECSAENLKASKKQRNTCVNMLRQTEKDY